MEPMLDLGIAAPVRLHIQEGRQATFKLHGLVSATVPQ